MTFHELMHGLVARWLGDETAMLMGRLTLNPLKHVDPFLTVMLPLLIIVTNALTGIPIKEMMKEGWLFLVMLLILLFTVTLVPEVILWLPQSMGYVTK